MRNKNKPQRLYNYYIRHLIYRGRNYTGKALIVKLTLAPFLEKFRSVSDRVVCLEWYGPNKVVINKKLQIRYIHKHKNTQLTHNKLKEISINYE